ncbi:MAG: murein biosynthesis integral membrane protein MurJ [Pseudomonadota bacterium]
MSLVGKFATVGGATLISRVLGFAREVMIAATLGAGPIADVFYAAFRFPNLFRRLFAEGAFNSAFIPLFARELEQSGESAAKRFAEEVLAVLLIVLLAITALAEIAMPWLVSTVVAPKFTGDKFTLTVEFTRIMFPYLAAMSLAAFLSAVLNSFRHYFVPAIVPVALNIILIICLASALIFDWSPQRIGRALSYGVLVSGLVQLGILFVAVRRMRFVIRWTMPHLSPAVRRLLILATPVAITGGITQVNLIIGQIIASAREGAIAVLSYADRIYQLPLGVIGIAIGVVLLPELSRALKANEADVASDLQTRSLEFAFALTLPAAIGIGVIPDLIVNVLFERGAFTAETTQLTAKVLAAFAWGLPAFVFIKVFTPSFFAHEDMRTPMWFAGASVVTNVIGSVLLFPTLGPLGIAIATSIASWLNAILLLATLLARGQFELPAKTLRRLAWLIVAGTIMGIALYFAHRALTEYATANHLAFRAGTLLSLIVGAALGYALLVMATGALPLAEAKAALRRRR